MKSLVLSFVCLVFVSQAAKARGVELPAQGHSAPRIVKIGILKEGDYDLTLKRWSNLSAYLNEQISDGVYKFEVVPLDFDELDSAAENGTLDFLVTNPSDYLWLESRHLAMRVLALKSPLGGTSADTASAVIVVRSDRSDLQRLADLKSRYFAAVDPHSFAGWQMAAREFARENIHPSKDFSQLEFKGSPARVLAAILDGSVDAGTVSSADFANVDASKFRVLEPKLPTEASKLARSTPLYPEWPIASLYETPEVLSKKVTAALLQMSPDDPRAIGLKCAGWTIPRGYRPVHGLMRELRLPPYQDLGHVSLDDALREYRGWLLTAFGLFVSLLAATIWVFRLNGNNARLSRKLETELSEREKAENALNVSETLYHSLVETLPQNIFRKGMDERFSFVNRRFCATLGRPADEILGKTDADFFPRELADKYRADDLKVIQGRTTYETVEKHVTPDGQVHHVQVIKTPLIDTKDEVVGTQCIFWDVTDKKRAEEELARSEERFALAVRGSNDGLFDWNIATGEIYYSPRFKELLGYPDHELPNTVEMHFDRIHPDDVERVQAKIKNHMKARVPFDVEYRAKTRSGEYLWFHARGQALWDNDGRAIRMAGSMSDITGRKMSEEQLREQNIKLHEMARSERNAHQELLQAQSRMVSTAKLAGLGEMVAGVAHEINNPLSFVSNNVCVLQRDLAEVTELIGLYRQNESIIEAGQPESVTMIRDLWDRVDMDYTLGNLPGLLSRTRDGLKRIQQIVKDLRVFARLDESDLNEVDLNAGIESTVNIVVGHAKKKQVRIELDLTPLPLVTCYPAKINQVIMNLVSNAIDASNEGGIVQVRTRPEGDAVVLEVQDHGTGMPAAVRERIFDPFFTTKPVGVGTGLGLSISYGIVADHGGAIEVESTEGQGTTFLIRLPKRARLQPAGTKPEPALASPVPI